MTKRTMLLLVGLVILAVVAGLCILLILREDGLSGSGVHFV